MDVGIEGGNEWEIFWISLIVEERSKIFDDFETPLGTYRFKGRA